MFWVLSLDNSIFFISMCFVSLGALAPSAHFWHDTLDAVRDNVNTLEIPTLCTNILLMRDLFYICLFLIAILD